MHIAEQILTIITFAVAWWLGLYLAARDLRQPALRRAAIGLLGYALALATTSFGVLVLASALALIPALMWPGAMLALLPTTHPWRARLDRGWRTGVLPLGLLAVLARGFAPGARTDLVTGVLALAWLALCLVLLARARWAAGVSVGHVGTPHAASVRDPGVGVGVGAAGAGVGVGAAGAGVGAAGAGVGAAGAGVGRPKHSDAAGEPRGMLRPYMAVLTIFFGLGAGLLLLPLAPGLRAIGLLTIGLDLVLLGIAIAWWDAFDAGETLRRDMARSALAAAAAMLLFGSQAIVIGANRDRLGLDDHLRDPLLFSLIASGIAVVVLGGPIQRLLDRLAFAGEPALRAAREELRTEAAALPRLPDAEMLLAADDVEFARLTRRALSSYADLPALAASPLAYLPQIGMRLAARHTPDQPTERAVELQSLLREAIERLRPRTGETFGTNDAWRYYNALHYPYVAGVKPYRRRDQIITDDYTRRILAYFDAQVPERTLYNWQNSAARLVARDLRAAMVAANGIAN